MQLVRKQTSFSFKDLLFYCQHLKWNEYDTKNLIYFYRQLKWLLVRENLRGDFNVYRHSLVRHKAGTLWMTFAGGAILILEKVLNEAKDGPLHTLIFDLAMLISAEGRERTAGEYRSLLESYGFTDVQVRLLPESSRRDAILARKPIRPRLRSSN